jgi:hypothetical protein
MGEIRATRRALLRVIRLRFPEVLTPDVERAISDQPSVQLMNAWLDTACDSKTAEEFLAILRR